MTVKDTCKKLGIGIGRVRYMLKMKIVAGKKDKDGNWVVDANSVSKYDTARKARHAGARAKKTKTVASKRAPMKTAATKKVLGIPKTVVEDED